MFDVTEVKREFRKIRPVTTRGRVVEVHGPIIHAVLSGAAVGDIVSLQTRDATQLLAQVVGFTKEISILSPFGSTTSIVPGSEVELKSRQLQMRLNPSLLGAVVDSMGQVIAAGEKGNAERLPEFIRRALVPAMRPLYAAPPAPLSRKKIDTRFETGIRAIDAFVTLGQGQRLSVFAEPGIGKTTLMGMIARAAQADVNVIALIGERGREVRELILETLDAETRARTVVVVSTSDEAAVCRVNAAHTATTIAEYFRDAGAHVLLQMDSLTRLFRAYREVGLAAGEVPVRQGYPPSVFARVPELIERAGTSAVGSITALYTLLLSANIDEDPMVEEIKGLTDGHLVLSRALAEAGHYPAIDVVASLSRLATSLLDDDTKRAQRILRALLARLADEKDLLALGGKSSPELQNALDLEPLVKDFLIQDANEISEFELTRTELLKLANKIV